MRRRSRNPEDDRLRGLERQVLAGDEGAAIQLYYEWRRSGRIPQRPEVVVESPFGPVGLIPTSDCIWLFAGDAVETHYVSMPRGGHVGGHGQKYVPRTNVPPIDIGNRFSFIAAYSRNASGHWSEGYSYHIGYGIHVELHGRGERPSTLRLRGVRRAAEQNRLAEWRDLERRAEEGIRSWALGFIRPWAAENQDLLRAGDVAQLATEMEQDRDGYEWRLKWAQEAQQTFARSVTNTLRAKQGLEPLTEPRIVDQVEDPVEGQAEGQAEP